MSVDFMVLEIEVTLPNDKEHTIILGKPFMAITMTVMEVNEERLIMTILEEIMNFQVFEPLLFPFISTLNKCAFIDYIDSTICETHFYENMENKINDSFIVRRVKESLEKLHMDDSYIECIRRCHNNSDWLVLLSWKQNSCM